MDYMTLKEASEKWGVTPRLHQERQRHAARVHRATDDQRAFRDEHRILRVSAVEELILRQARVHVKLWGGKV